jgi:hypothetical protein
MIEDGVEVSRAQWRTIVVLSAAALTVFVCFLADRRGPTPGIAALGFLLVVGELVGFRLGDGSFVPLAPAIVLVLVRLLAMPQGARNDDLRFVVVLLAAQLFAGLAQPFARFRVRAVGIRVAGALAAYGAYACEARVLGGRDERTATLVSLAVAALVLMVVDLSGRQGARSSAHRSAGRRWSGLRHSGGLRAYSALAASGVLMALGDHGVSGDRSMGLWGVGLFAVPLLFAWYSFSRVDAVRRTTMQTIRALSIVPERANLSPPGHAERVARLSNAIATEIDLVGPERDSLEQAALLHHLGGVCLDDLDLRRMPVEPAEVTETTARMLRETGHLSEAARVLDAAALHHRGRDLTVPPETRLAAQILKVASDYDDLTEGSTEHAPQAIDSLYAAPGYVYDPRVLAALERVLATSSV